MILRPALVLALALGLGCTEQANDDDVGGSATETTATDGETDATGSDSTTEGSTACTAELESIRTEIFATRCTNAGCHAGAEPAADLDLAAADLEAELVGIPGAFCEGTIRVVPQQPEASLLYTKVAGPVPCGERMPFGSELDDAAKACMFDWIAGLDPLSCETCGGDACVDVEIDPNHCGECGNACPLGVDCIAGSCTCPDGEDLCDGACIDTQADPANCGECGNACDANSVCWQGICADTCGTLTDCEGGCVDTTSDPDNCGTCGNACPLGGACVDSGCGCSGDGVSFAAEVQPIFTANCTGIGCHRPPTNAATLNLSAGASFAELVGVTSSQCANKLLVTPGQPDASYLMNKLQGVDLCFGTIMPKIGGALSDSEIATISEWICRGAQND